MYHSIYKCTSNYYVKAINQALEKLHFYVCYKGEVSLQTQNSLIGINIFFSLIRFSIFFFLIGIGFGDRVTKSIRIQQIYILSKEKDT